MPHDRGMEPNRADEDAEWDALLAEEEADRQRKLEPPPLLTPQEFADWRSPRVVDDNPTRLDNPLWQWLVRTRWSAFQANEQFNGPSAFSAGTMWYFDRFGISRTPLPDARVVHIGGEHEDFYGPDFCIFNDVTVIGEDGDIAIFGYPREDFPPTDFHSATLLGDGTIALIGRLGYGDERVVSETPVYRLALDSMRMSRLATLGDAPGWIPSPHVGPVFPLSAMALCKGFTRALERAQARYVEDRKEAGQKLDRRFLADAHFHDTRHEAASRLAEELSNVLELSAVTGHRDLRMLKRYYHPRAEDLARKLG